MSFTFSADVLRARLGGRSLWSEVDLEIDEDAEIEAAAMVDDDKDDEIPHPVEVPEDWL